MSNDLAATLPKVYEPREVETRWYPYWEASGYFAADRNPSGQPFCIMIPPPNVTGSLHMGHAFQDTLMDALTRYHRMRGDRALWQSGSDHAGIATQMVVERQLEEEGTSRQELGREAFIRKVWEWKESSGNMISQQLRRLGGSCDWARERFTMDEGLSRAVQEVFIQLYREGLIYRGERLVNWDPILRTAISDLEVASEEEPGRLWHFRYPLTDSSETLVVATTRPETMLGDTAVAVHPEDVRYHHLIGRSVRLPLVERAIPIIADEAVDPEFGSGCVKVTPAHDFNDYSMGERHGLPRVNIFTGEARINDQAPAAYQGLDRYEARERVVADLEAEGLLEAVTEHSLMIPRGDRTGTVIEPFLTEQWFVRVGPLAEPAIEAVESGAIRFIPENWAKTYFEWMRNIQDWCISRQIWWGHRIPAWYDPAGHTYVGHSEAEVRAAYGLDSGVPLEQDPDVLDTWFSSALWPFSTLGWPEETEALRTFYPTSVLVTGFDIIFFWVARMIMMGLKFMGDVPFREVYVHGLVRDSEGNKMSKSKGNILDPLDLIEGIDLEPLVAKRTANLMQPAKAQAIAQMTRREFPDGIPAFGADALRLTFASLATQGRDIKFDLGRIEGYRHFCTKLWNAARLNLMHVNQPPVADTPPAWTDRWISSRLQRTIQAVVQALEAYRFSDAASAAYDFVWHAYCDWYLELVKPALHGEDPGAAERGRWTMISVLETALRLLHPLIPFITEELWQRVAPLTGRSGPTIMLAPFPSADEGLLDPEAEAEFAWLEGFVGGVRSIRGEMDIPASRPLPLCLRGGDALDRERVAHHRTAIETLVRPESITWLDSMTEPPKAATALVGELQILVPLAGLIDVEAEIQRLDKELGKITAELERSREKLDNPNFCGRAPAEVVDKEKAKLEEFESRRSHLQGQRERLEQLR